MLALCSMLLGTYYAQNYASIIGGSLAIFDYIWWFRYINAYSKRSVTSVVLMCTTWYVKQII